MGLLWLMLLLYLGRIKINFFNFVALPITFGIGVDYAVNVMQRVLNGGGVIPAMRSTGGAVVLNSLHHDTGVPRAARLGEPGGALAGPDRGARAGLLPGGGDARPAELAVCGETGCSRRGTSHIPSGAPREATGG